MRREALRPAVHAALIGFVLLEPDLGKWRMAGIAFAAFVLNLLVLPLTPLGTLLRREGEPRWNGLVTYPLAVALGHALFSAEIAGLAWAVLALGDPAAALAGGARPWKWRIPWNRRKSVAGSLAFLVVAWAAAAGLLVLSSPFAELDGPLLLLLGSMALAGALAETLPLRDDNLPVLLAAGGVGQGMALLLAQVGR